MYRTGPSVKHRKEHESWNGLVLPKNDPWWDSHFPPNGWGCKCYTRAVTESQRKKYEAEGIPVPQRTDGSGGGSVRIKTEAPPVKYKTYFNERKGTVEQVPEGVDPAFNWNQGKADREKILKAMLDESRRKYNETVESVIPHLSGKQKISDTQRIHSNYIKELTANKVDNLGVYSSGKGANINREIYKLGKNWEKSILAPVIKTLDDVISNAPKLTEETFFFKGDYSKIWETARVDDIRPIEGFFSTAIRKSVAERYATDKLNTGEKPIMIVIRASAGTKGLYIGEKTEYHKGNEFEYLFPRGAKFRVLEKDVSHVLVEAVNDH
jgi:hypothetical protein